MEVALSDGRVGEGAPLFAGGDDIQEDGAQNGEVEVLVQRWGVC